MDITDEILDVLMQLVYQLLMHGQLMLGRLLRSKVLSKYDHRNSSRNKHSLVSIASLQVNTKLVFLPFYFFCRALNQIAACCAVACVCFKQFLN